MVVGYFNFARPIFCPNETEAVLIVDADAVLSLSAADQRLQLVAWGNSEIVEIRGGIELVQLSQRD